LNVTRIATVNEMSVSKAKASATGTSAVGFMPSMQIIAPQNIPINIGDSKVINVTILNSGPSFMQAVVLEVQGIPSELVTINPLSQPIDSKQSKDFEVEIFVPSYESVGVKDITFHARDGGVDAYLPAVLTIGKRGAIVGTTVTNVTNVTNQTAPTGGLLIFTNPTFVGEVIFVILLLSLIYLYLFKKESWNALVGYFGKTKSSKTSSAPTDTDIENIKKEIIGVKDTSKPVDTKQAKIEVTDFESPQTFSFTVEYEDR